MPTMDPAEIRLTETVKKGGCAAKLPAGMLREMLGSLEVRRSRDVRVGVEEFDDAALSDLGDGRLLIQTLDFFTPIVDDAFDFGAIAAANALSDVYAMGGRPSTALSILCFPAATLPGELLRPLMKGALEKIHEAGASLVGGHSIDDETLKLGFSVAGFVDRERAWTNAGARVGDRLILTKALGTGTITSALKSRKAGADAIAAAVASMKTLNNAVDLINGSDGAPSRDGSASRGPAARINAATDITGFALAGHALQMAQMSRKSFVIESARLPALEGARALLREGVLNRAHKTNEAYTRERVHWEGVADDLRWLTLDPQTSGGLLLSVPAADASALIERLRSRFEQTCEIGHVAEAGELPLRFV